MNHGIGKRIITTILISVTLLQIFCVGLVTPVSAAEDTRYPDVIVGKKDITQEHFDAINYLYDNGFMIGVNNKGKVEFQPGAKLSRAMVVTVLYRMSGETEDGISKFTDLNQEWYKLPVFWGESTGIVKGISNTKFEPDRDVQRQEAITFLYRYANYYYKDTMPVSGSITSRPGYNDIEWKDAQDAMRWAVCYGILSDAPQIDLAPKEAIDRKTFALYVYRMCINAIGITQSDKHLSQNRLDELNESFSDRYVIGYHQYEKLKGYANGLIDEISLWAHIGSTWDGSCEGMAMTCILDKTGKIAFNENVAKNAKTMHDVPKFASGDRNLVKVTNSSGDGKISLALSIVNYYQTLQKLEIYKTTVGEVEAPSRKNLEEMLDMQSHGGVACFAFHYKNNRKEYGHSVVVYGKPKFENNQYYTLKVYNPNNNTGNYYLRIPNTMDSCQFVSTNSKGNKTITEVLEFNYFTADQLDYFDVDGPKNEMFVSARSETKNSKSPSVLKSELGREAVIMFDAHGELQITNANGEKMHYKNGKISGNMKILEERTIANGPDTPITYILRVGKSNSYKCVVSSQESRVVIIDASKYASVNGTGVKKVDITSKDVNVIGTNMNVEVVSSHGCSDDRHLRVIANDETQIDIANTLGNIGVTTKNSAKAVVENSTTRELMHQFEKNAGGITIWGINTDSPSALDTQVKGSIRDGVKPLG